MLVKAFFFFARCILLQIYRGTYLASVYVECSYNQTDVVDETKAGWVILMVMIIESANLTVRVPII